MELTPEKQKLINDLTHQSEECRTSAQRYARIAYAMAILAIIASVLTSLSVAFDWFPKWVNAVLAAVPAFVAFATGVFKFEAHVGWWRERMLKCNALISAIKYEGQHESNISPEWSKFLVNHEKRRPKLGRLPATSIQEQET